MGRIRLQVIVAILAIVAVVAVMGYVALNVTTVSVPDFGGTYVEGIAGNPHRINPLLCHPNPVDQDLVALVFSGLTRPDDRGELVPDLAERWEVSRGGTAYTFYLRQDVRWHDDAPFTSDDVVYTIGVMQDGDFRGSTFLSDMWRTVTVERIDSYTVRFVLREPFAPFLDYTTTGILPAHVLGSVPVAALGESKFNASPIGTGPFQMAEVSARRILLTANPNYYRSRPYIDRLEFIFYPSDAAVFEARGRREVAGIARVLPEHLDAVRQDDGLELHSAPLSGYNLVFLNLDRGIFQDRAVRQAMMWALDRQGLVDEILGGQGVVIHSPILPSSWAYAPDVTKYALDPRKAREVLEEAGWFDDDGDGVRERGGLKLEFALATNEDDPVRLRLIQSIGEQLENVGFGVRLEPTPWEDLVGRTLRLRRFDAVLSGWQSLPPDPDLYPYWHSSQANEDGLNFANYISEEADTLLAEARFEQDRETRTSRYRDFQRLFADEVPSLLLYQPVYSYAVDSSVHSVQIGPMLDSGDRFHTVARWYIATQRMLYSEARDQGFVSSPR